MINWKSDERLFLKKMFEFSGIDVESFAETDLPWCFWQVDRCRNSPKGFEHHIAKRLLDTADPPMWADLPCSLGLTLVLPRPFG